MKKVIWFLLLILLVSSILFGSKYPLPELLNPQNLVIDDDDLYIGEGTSIYHYSLKNCQLKKRFGQEGEAPGEFKVYPGQSVQVNVKPDYIVVSSIGKITFLSRNGDYIREKKIASILGTPFIPWGDKFVGTGYDRLENKFYVTFNIFDADFKKISELDRFEFRAGQGFTFFERAFYFQVYGDMVFLSGGKEFVIDVFDRLSKRKYRIQHQFMSEKVTSLHIKEVLNWYQSNPATKQFYDIINKQAKFPDYFPAIRNFLISNGILFIQTFSGKDHSTEFIIMNLEGKIQKKVYLPIARSNPAEQNQLFTIVKNRLYQIIENQEEELWELYVLNIK